MAQEREFEPVSAEIGGIPVDVRVIAATSCDLSTEVGSGEFRRDLFYQLNVFPIHVPPLREQREDILLLAKYFIPALCGECPQEDSMSGNGLRSFSRHITGGGIYGSFRT